MSKIETIIDLDEEFDTREIRNGAFWSYLNKTKIDLSRYQIFSVLDKNNYKDNKQLQNTKVENFHRSKRSWQYWIFKRFYLDLLWFGTN